MNDLLCHEIDELLAAYAADALDEDERYAVAVHLAECRHHDAELQAIRLDLESLALSVEAVEPPPALRASLLDAFDLATAGSPVLLRDQAGNEPGPAITSGSTPKPRVFAGASFVYALAAALLVVAIGLGAWGLSRGGEDVLVLTTVEGDARLQLTYLTGHNLAVLDLNLPDLPAAHSYQAWHIADGTPVSVGILDSMSGRLAFEADLEPDSAIALTLEPEGGSTLPTTEPFLVTALDGR